MFLSILDFFSSVKFMNKSPYKRKKIDIELFYVSSDVTYHLRGRGWGWKILVVSVVPPLNYIGND